MGCRLVVRRFVRFVVLLALVLVVALLLYYFYCGLRNYQGYCKETGKVMSDQEKIRVAVFRVIRLYPPVLNANVDFDDGRKALRFFKPENPILYDSSEQFLLINKDCCQVTYRDKGDFGKEGGEIPLIERIMGWRSSNVRVRYQVRYWGEDGSVVSSEVDQFIPIENCAPVY
ncbi:hypothetical protein [Stutzerimonas kirkiae]|uniref:hypothetical protein n=1 Tax=Stutzerimonas kirkiae TaxID=2211392 RepID=UPI0010384041|nr:hypothetical protein [Stutzerimonas kirkiae]